MVVDGLWAVHTFTVLVRCDALLQILISVNVNLPPNFPCYGSLKHSCQCHSPWGATYPPCSQDMLGTQSTSWQRSSLHYCDSAGIASSGSCVAHWWALTFLPSINVKWVFVTSVINYHYWHCDCVWQYLGWKLKNGSKKEVTQLLSSSFMGWNASFKNTGFSWSQCLSDFLKQIVDLW